MNTSSDDNTDLAIARLEDVWYPNRIVFYALSKWFHTAFVTDKYEVLGCRVLRWCKWQRLKLLHDSTNSFRLSEEFARFYRRLSFKLPDISPLISYISDEDLYELENDISAMEEFFSNLHQPKNSRDIVGSGIAIHCERYLWGPFAESEEGSQVHFWPLFECFKNSGEMPKNR